MNRETALGTRVQWTDPVGHITRGSVTRRYCNAQMWFIDVRWDRGGDGRFLEKYWPPELTLVVVPVPPPMTRRTLVAAS